MILEHLSGPKGRNSDPRSPQYVVRGDNPPLLDQKSAVVRNNSCHILLE